jgi:hypothetical protein
MPIVKAFSLIALATLAAGCTVQPAPLAAVRVQSPFVVEPAPLAVGPAPVFLGPAYRPHPGRGWRHGHHRW